MTKKDADIRCDEIEKSFENFKLDVKEDIAGLRSDFSTVSAAVNKIGIDVAILNANISLLLKKHTPCELYNDRITKLENTKLSISVGWKTILIVGGAIMSLCSIGGLVAQIMLRGDK